jgi:hypothetical protein
MIARTTTTTTTNMPRNGTSAATTFMRQRYVCGASPAHGAGAAVTAA